MVYKDMAYSVSDVCRHVIHYSNEQDNGISNLKLQKVLYFIQAYFLISTSSPCFQEKIEAWDIGPVIPEAYRAYKQFGIGDIPDISYDVDDIISDADKRRMEEVVDRLADYSATDLVSLTQRQSPWMNAYTPYMDNEITLDAIKEYFTI